MLEYAMGFIHLYNGHVAQVRSGNPKKTPPLCLVKGLQGGRKGHMKSICCDSDTPFSSGCTLEMRKNSPHIFSVSHGTWGFGGSFSSTIPPVIRNRSCHYSKANYPHCKCTCFTIYLQFYCNSLLSVKIFMLHNVILCGILN